MKRTATAVDQPGKTETTPQPMQRHASTKFHKDHKMHDHAHGRVNKNPIFFNFGPY